MWLKGQATQATIVDKITKLVAGEVADDVGNTVPVGDRWIRQVAGQDFLHSPSSTKVALPVMAMRAGYYQPSNNRRANEAGLNGNWIRQSSISTGTPATRYLVAVQCRQANTVAGDYSTAIFRVMCLNADTGASLYNNDHTPNAAGLITLGAGAGGGQITVGNSETGLLSADPQGSFGNFGGSHYRLFDATYPGGIDFWPLEYRRYTGESSTFTVAPPGAAGTDYVKDVRIPTNHWSTSATGSRPSHMHLGGGFGIGLGIKTNTGLGGGALYSVSWNVYAMGIHLSLSANQYLAAELNGGRAPTASDGVYRRMQGTRHTTWLRMFTGTPVTSSAVQYWICVKADRIIIVLNGDPGVGGVLTCAGLWRFTPDADATNDLFPWAYTGNVIGYQADTNNADAALAPTRAWPLIAQQAAVNGYAKPASRDWATGWMRTDCACPTNNGGQNGQSTGAGAGILVDNDAGSEGGNDSTGLAMGGTSQPLNGGSRPYLGVPGGRGEQSNANGWEYERAYPLDEAKPWPGDGKWWLYGHVYFDSTATQGAASHEGNHYRGKLDGCVLWIPSTGWSSGDELTDTVTGKTYFLVAADYAGAGMGRARLSTNVYRGGVAIEEAA